MGTIGNQALAAAALTLAIGYAKAGTSRRSDHDQVTRFLEVQGLPFYDADGKPYPYCAAFVSYCYEKAAAQLAGRQLTASNAVGILRAYGNQIPFAASASVPTIVVAAKSAGRWRKKGDVKAQPGWLVVYCWNGTGEAQHIGLFRASDAEGIMTVEGNTSDDADPLGGAVACKSRTEEFVLGYVATY